MLLDLASNFLEFLTVFVAAYKGIPAGDRWVHQYVAAIKANTEAILEKNNNEKKQ